MTPLAALLAVAAAPDGGFRTVPLPPAERRFDDTRDAVAGSPDGKLVAVATGSAVNVWEAATGRLATRLHLPVAGGTTQLAFAADGKSLVCANTHEPAVRWFDLRTGKPTRERALPAPRQPDGGRYAPVLGFGPGGEWYVAINSDEPGRQLRTVDTATGRPGANIDGQWSFSTWTFAQSVAAGRLVVGGGFRADPVQVWDVAAGKSLFALAPLPTRAGSNRQVIGTSADGKLVALYEGYTGVPRGRAPDHELSVWGLDDGRRRCVVRSPGYAASAAFSADGRTLAVGGAGNFCLIDLVADAVRPELALPRRGGARVASPDGRLLAVLDTPAGDGDALLHLGEFPTLPDPVPAAGDLVGDQLTEWRASLGSDNEFRRRHAVRAFAARPDQAVYEAARVKPEPAARLATVADLLAVLDDDAADTRDKAYAELAGLAHRFEPVLAAAQKAAPPGEVRNRLTTLLNTVRQLPPPPDLLADLSTVEFLTAVNTPEARALLAKLAGGAAGSRLTAAAAASVKK